MKKKIVIRNKLLNINKEDYKVLLTELKQNDPDYKSFAENITFSEEDKKEIALMSNAEREDMYDAFYRGRLDSTIENARVRLVILIGLISNLEITESRANFLYKKMIQILVEQFDEYKTVIKLNPVDLKDIKSNFNEELLVNMCNSVEDLLSDLDDNYLILPKVDEIFGKKPKKKAKRMLRLQFIFMLNDFYFDNLHNQEIAFKQFRNYKKKILKLCKF